MQRLSSFWMSSRDNKQRRGSASTTASKHAETPARRVREDYWPTTLDRETEKAARILHSFCTEGYIAHHDDPAGSPRSSISSVQIKKKIPPRIVQNAVGLAVFSCMRSGLWKSGSGGSGILVARKSDGTWSAPSGLLLHTAALGFVIGVDVYDCVLVINTLSDLEMFTRAKTTLGYDVELAVGPVMSAGHMENGVQGKDLGQAVMTYVKARGEHRAVNIDGSLVTERTAENHRFYGRTASVLDIIAGRIPHLDSPELKIMYEVIKSAEGRVDFDARMLEHLALQPAPGDAVIDNPAILSPLSPGVQAFGVPDNEDLDPFGVKALEMAGLEIREAGTNLRPSSSQFEYNPSPTSPLFGQFNHRQSVDTYRTQSNSNRASCMSNRTTFSRMTDAFTQTTIDTRVTTPSSEDGHDWASVDRLPVVMEPVDVDYTQIDDSAIKRWSQEHLADESTTADKGVGGDMDGVVGKTVMAGAVAESQDEVTDLSNENLQVDERDEDADDENDNSEADHGVDPLDEDEDEDEDEEEEDEENDEDDFDEDEPVIFEVFEAQAVQAAQPVRTAVMSSQVTQVTHAKGALVTIPKRIAPPVPLRSPARSSKSDFGDIPAKSPLRNSFQSSRSSKSSVADTDVLSMDGVMSSLKTEIAANVTPASPTTQHEPETPASEKRLSSDSQGTHAIYTTVMENRLSMEDMPKTPSTLQTSGHTSSGDEQEPRTPKPEEDVDPAEDEHLSEKLAHEGVRRSLIVEAA